MIRFVDLRKQYEVHKDSIDAHIQSVLDSGHFVMGNKLKYFEDAFAKYNGSKYCLGVNSGTDALILAMKAYELEGKEVILPANTFVADIEAVIHAGAIPVLVDCEKDTPLMDLKKLKSLITVNTGAVIVVHLYGQVVSIDKVRKIVGPKIKIIEDACQATGALSLTGENGSDEEESRVGSSGNIGIFSFYPSKTLGAYGDGGAIITNNEYIYDKIASLRDHGSFKKTSFKYIGYNSRLDEMQAAILTSKLFHLDDWNSARQELANTYEREILTNNNLTSHIKLPETTDMDHVYHIYCIEVKEDERDELREHLNTVKIQTGIHYPFVLNEHGPYKNVKCGDLTNSYKKSRRILSLPIYPELTLPEIKIVVKELGDFYG